MKSVSAIFQFLLDLAAQGQRSVLVTLTDVTGGSSRAPGTHLAVSETGDYLGSLSGGCIETAVVAEALAVLERGRARQVRYGAGSPYLDIRLPCGGGIDLLFTPDPPASVIEQAADLLDRRASVSLALGLDGTCGLDQTGDHGWLDETFLALHEPDLRLVIAGQGQEVISLARQAKAFDADVVALSPDEAILAACPPHATTALLPTPRSIEHITADPRTAIVFLFHDHDWEADLLCAALKTPAFFIGAMGSRQTHSRRLERLASLGVPAEELARITGPIGVIPATRDPDTLALSVLAQVASMASTSASHDYILRYTA